MVSNKHIVTDKTSTEKWLAENSIAFEVRTPNQLTNAVDSQPRTSYDNRFNARDCQILRRVR